MGLNECHMHGKRSVLLRALNGCGVISNMVTSSGQCDLDSVAYLQIVSENSFLGFCFV